MEKHAPVDACGAHASGAPANSDHQGFKDWLAEKADQVTNLTPALIFATVIGAGNVCAAEIPQPASAVEANSPLSGLGLSSLKLKQFQALSESNRATALDFYKGICAYANSVFKVKEGMSQKEKDEVTAQSLAFRKEGMTKIIRLLAFHEENQKALISLKKTPNATVGLSVVNDTIAELSDPKTYGAILVSPSSPYSNRFVAIRDEATRVFAEAKPLQEASVKMESPELVAARQRLATAEQKLADDRAKLAEQRKVNAALDQVLATARRH